MPTEKKIFCEGCEYYNWRIGGYGLSVRWCEHPDNMIYKHNAVREWGEYPDIEDINKNNDCGLWKRRKGFWERIFNKETK